MNKIRKPVVAGFFYPSDSQKLSAEIKNFLSISIPNIIPQKVFGIVSPHAGYFYSGHTAAFGYNIIKDKNYKTVIIISPSHREYFSGISIYEGNAFETPLGIVEINNDLADSLTNGSKYIFRGVVGHKEEHAIEVQIPFLQTVLNDFKIVPIVMGDQRKIFVDELAEKISEIFDNDTLVIASSDLSHYHSKREAFELDSIVEQRIKDFDFENLLFDLERRNCEACGGGPIVAMMEAAWFLNKKRAIILNRSDSGDVSGDNTQVVGYISAAVYGENV
jgi:AmmeMemoRadiSam system protein B